MFHRILLAVGAHVSPCISTTMASNGVLHHRPESENAAGYPSRTHLFPNCP